MKIINTKSFKLAITSRGDENSQKLALVLPGQLDTKDYLHMMGHVDYLAKKGFLAVSFDPPGTWESGDDLSIYTMTNYLKAINEIIEYFGNRPTMLVGHSRGGAMTLAAGLTNPHVIAVVDIMGTYTFNPELNPLYRDAGEWETKGYKDSYRDNPKDPEHQKHFKLPYKFFKDSLQYDQAPLLPKSKIPKLFIFGTDDDLVKPAIIKAAYNLAAEPKMLYALESDHNYRHHLNLVQQVNNVIDEFIDKYKLGVK